MSFEDQLREALRQEPAPADFRAKLMARVQAESGAAVVTAPWWKRRLSLALAAALVAGAVIPAGVLERQRLDRERGLAARNQLLTALAVTNSTLRHTREMIRRNTRHS